MRGQAWIVVAGMVLAAGCKSPWSPSPPAAPAVAAAGKPAEPARGSPDRTALRQVLDEVQRMSDVDEPTRQALMDELGNTDPSLWPLVVQQFRATLAYRQQALAARTAANPQGLPPTAAVAQKAAPAEEPPAQVPARVAENPPPAAPERKTERASGTVPVVAAADSKPPAVAAADDSAAPVPPIPVREIGKVMAASFVAPPAGTSWKEHLEAAIRAREAEIEKEAKTSQAEARHAQLRLMYLLAGRRDDALKAIPGASPAVQGFWSESCYGLSPLLDEQPGDPARRAAEARQHVGDAIEKLAAAAPLLIRNMAFCTSIQSFGCMKAFEKYEFAPGENVLLYAEVENLAAESTPQGMHTRLQSSYQIFDARGQRVVDHEFTTTDEYCRNARRDYFIGYQFRIPERIYPGKHTLQLSIEDLISRKIGQSTIEFTVKKTGP